MVTVWFIRHAESESNAGLPTIDPASTSITTRGQQQAQHLATILPQPPSLIVTSPYIRTKQTAAPTIRRFAAVPQAEWQVQEFTFLAPNQYHNTTVQQRRPKVEAYWQRCDPFYVDGDGAESFADLVERVRQIRSQITRLEDNFVVVFSHGRFMRAVLWVLLINPLEINAKTMRQFRFFSDGLRVPNGSILKAQFHEAEVWLSGLITSHLHVDGLRSDGLVSHPTVEP